MADGEGKWDYLIDPEHRIAYVHHQFYGADGRRFGQGPAAADQHSQGLRDHTGLALDPGGLPMRALMAQSVPEIGRDREHAAATEKIGFEDRGEKRRRLPHSAGGPGK